MAWTALSISLMGDIGHLRDTWNAKHKAYLPVRYEGIGFTTDSYFHLLWHSLIFLVWQTFERLKHTSVTRKDENKKPQMVKSNGRGHTKKTDPHKWLMRTEKCSQVLIFLRLSRCRVTVNALMVAESARRTQISVHLHLFCARLRLLAPLCFPLSFRSSLLSRRAVVSSAGLVVHLGGLLHCGLWPVDHWITYVLHLLEKKQAKENQKMSFSLKEEDY